MHMFMRSSEKIVRCVVKRGMSMSHRLSAEEIDLRIAAMAKLMNSKIDISREQNVKEQNVRQHVKFDVVNATSASVAKVKYSLSARNMKKVILSTYHTKKGGPQQNNGAKEMLDTIFVTEEERNGSLEEEDKLLGSYQQWLDFFGLYVEIMQLIGHAEDPSVDEINSLQDKIDQLYVLFLTNIGDFDDITIYFHCLFSGHATQLMRMHGSLAANQQQSLERMVGEIKRTFANQTTRTGCDRTMVEGNFPFCARKIAHYCNNGTQTCAKNPKTSDFKGDIFCI